MCLKFILNSILVHGGDFFRLPCTLISILGRICQAFVHGGPEF